MGLHMSLSYLRVNFVNISGEPNSIWTMGCRASHLPEPEIMRRSRHFFSDSGFLKAHAGEAAVISNAGWHLSYMADEARIRKKIRAFSHQEFNRPDVLGGIDISQILKTGQDLFDRPGYKWELREISNDLPQQILREPSRFAHWIEPYEASLRIAR